MKKLGVLFLGIFLISFVSAGCQDVKPYFSIGASGGYTNLDNIAGKVGVQVVTGAYPDGENISGIQITTTVASGAITRTEDFVIGRNQAKVFTYTEAAYKNASFVLIDIAPILTINNTKQVCDVSDSERLTKDSQIDNSNNSLNYVLVVNRNAIVSDIVKMTELKRELDNRNAKYNHPLTMIFNDELDKVTKINPFIVFPCGENTRIIVGNTAPISEVVMSANIASYFSNFIGPKTVTIYSSDINLDQLRRLSCSYEMFNLGNITEVEQSNTQTCTESDGGRDIYVKGTNYWANTTYNDYCTTKVSVNEYYCQDGKLEFKNEPCENGCKDGVCIQISDSNENNQEDDSSNITLDKNLTNISNSNESPVEQVCNTGCSLDGKCLSFGYRKTINKTASYCFESGQWLPQKQKESTCENNFECSSNVCASGKCIDSSLLQRILEWFRKLFA